LPFAVSDAAGEWKVRIRDSFTGETKEILIAVN